MNSNSKKNSSKDKKETPLLQKKKFPKEIENLFEEFFVFGIRKGDLSSAVENKNIEQIILPPKILYSYPDPTEIIKK